MLRGWKDTGRWLSWSCASPIGLYQDLVTSASPTCSVKPDHAFCASRPPCHPLHIYRSLSIHGALQKRFHSCFAERSLCSEHACVCRFVCIQVDTHMCVWVWVCVWVCLCVLTCLLAPPLHPNEAMRKGLKARDNRWTPTEAGCCGRRETKSSKGQNSEKMKLF